MTISQASTQANVGALSQLLTTLQSRHDGWQQAQQLLAAQLAPNFSLFTVQRNHEVDVSRHLALLLDPQGTHGQGSLFWDAWVEQVLQAQRSPSVEAPLSEEADATLLHLRGPAQAEVAQAAPLHSGWLRHCAVHKVEREHRTTELADNNRRAIDLCVRLQGGLLAIENKPWHASVDEHAQLTDYAEHLALLAQRSNADWTLVYLGHGTPSPESLPPERYAALVRSGNLVCVGWGQLLQALKQCLPHIQAPKVRWFVEDFVQMMERDVMNYKENAEMEHVAQAFNQSPQALHSAVLLRNTLKQWQASQLKKLKQQLEARCTPAMDLQWHIEPDASQKKQACFTLAFPGRSDVVMRVEWFWGFAHESDFYWGVHAPAMDLEQSQALGGALMQALLQAEVTLPAIEPVETGWPLWSFFSADPVFTPQGSAEDSSAEVVHPWLSVDRTERDFVSLVLQRYGELAAALKQAQ